MLQQPVRDHLVQWSRSALLGGAGILLLAVSAGRWHAAAVAAPLSLASLEGPAAVLVLQEGDCPDRSAALARWLEPARDAWGEAVPLAVAWIGGVPAVAPPLLEDLPRLPEEDVVRAGRALLRLESEGTPALLLVDRRGVPLVGETFGEAGLGPRLGLVLGMLEPLLGTEVDRWNP
jgi:hypothetical protein